MELTYGIDVKSLDDEYMRLVQEGNDIFMKAFVPGKYLVETFPILKRVPAWFPGAKFRREAAEWKEAYAQVRTRPFKETMDKLVRSKTCQSYILMLIGRSTAGTHLSAPRKGPTFYSGKYDPDSTRREGKDRPLPRQAHKRRRGHCLPR